MNVPLDKPNYNKRLRKVTYKIDRMIIIIYLKPYDCLQITGVSWLGFMAYQPLLAIQYQILFIYIYIYIYIY